MLLAFAASPAVAAEAPVVVAVRVAAPGLDDPTQALDTLGLEVGHPLDRARLRRGAQVLYASGEVERLRVEAEPVPAGVEVAVHLALRPRVERLVVDGPGLRLRARVRAWLELRPGAMFSGDQLEARARRVERRLHDLGYRQARVDHYVDFDPTTTTAVVTLEVEPGPLDRLGSVRLEGVPADLEDAMADAVARSGARLSASQLGRVRRRVEAELRRAGLWEAEVVSVERRPRPDGMVDLQVAVAPGPRYRLAVVAPPDRTELVRASVPDPVDEDIHPAQTEALAEQVRTELQRRGYLLARAGVTLSTADEERVLEVVGDPGRRVRVTEVLYDGAVSIRKKRLDAAVQVRRGRVGGWRGQQVSDATLGVDRLSLEDLYLSNGFAEVEVAPARLEPDGEDGVRVVFPVVEGPRWLLVDLHLEGFPVEAAAALEETGHGLREGGPWDARATEGARRQLELILAGAGYPEGRVEAEVTTEPGAARVRFRADPGPFVRVGSVAVAGLGRTRPGVVRRELEHAGVEPGQTLSRTALLKAQRQLSELGLFRRVELAQIPGQERGDERGVVVRCEEGEQRSYLFGLGWDTTDGVRLTLGWSHLNLFGGAHAVSVETRLSGREERFQASLREPRLPWLGLPGYATVYRTEEDYTSFSQQRRGLWFEVGDRRLRPWRRWLRYEYQIVDPDAPDEILSDLEREQQRIRIASLTPALEWDTRDDPLSPRRGVLTSGSLEWAFPAFTADANFLKLQAGLSAYGKLPWGTGAAGLRVGLLRPLDAPGDQAANLEVPIASRFFAGGRTSHRAFPTDRLGIEGETLTDTDPVGGAAMVLLNLEYRRPVHGPLEVVLLLDGGNVWAEGGDVSLGEMRWGVGLGLRYGTPAGPLRLEYGLKLDREEGESRGELHLSFGVPF